MLYEEVEINFHFFFYPNATTTNGNTYLIVCDNTSARNRIKLAGSGGTTVTSDDSGNITINSTASSSTTIRDNLTGNGVTNAALSANQGYVLKGLIDGKADSGHTHSYLPLSGGTLSGALTVNANISSSGNISTTSGQVYANNIYCSSGSIVFSDAGTTNHCIQAGISGRDYTNFYEFGGVWNFIRSQSGSNYMSATINDNGIRITRQNGVGAGTYDVAPLTIVNNNVNSGGRAAIGLHNEGNTGLTLYLETNGRLYCCTNGGQYHNFWASYNLGFSLSGTTLTITTS